MGHYLLTISWELPDLLLVPPAPPSTWAEFPEFPVKPDGPDPEDELGRRTP